MSRIDTTTNRSFGTAGMFAVVTSGTSATTSRLETSSTRGAATRMTLDPSARSGSLERSFRTSRYG